MSRATPDDQLKFLLNCVKHSNNGKIDFVEVAKECGIVSKGAAAKRYERLMKANGIHPNGGPSDKPLTHAVPRQRSKASIARAAAAKKRKIEGIRPDLKDEDDDEDELHLKPKTEPKYEPIEAQDIKNEPVMIASPCKQTLVAHPTQHYSQPVHNYVLAGAGYMPQMPPRPQYVLSDGPSIFDDFCTPELFSHHSFGEILAEQPLLMPPPTLPLVEPERRAATVEEVRSESGTRKWPLDSILIVD